MAFTYLRRVIVNVVGRYDPDPRNTHLRDSSACLLSRSLYPHHARKSAFWSDNAKLEKLLKTYCGWHVGVRSTQHCVLGRRELSLANQRVAGIPISFQQSNQLNIVKGRSNLNQAIVPQLLLFSFAQSPAKRHWSAARLSQIRGDQPFCNCELLLVYRLIRRATSLMHTSEIKILLNLPLIIRVLIMLMLFLEQARGRPTWSLRATLCPRAPCWWRLSQTIAARLLAVGCQGLITVFCVWFTRFDRSSRKWLSLRDTQHVEVTMLPIHVCIAFFASPLFQADRVCVCLNCFLFSRDLSWFKHVLN